MENLGDKHRKKVKGWKKTFPFSPDLPFINPIQNHSGIYHILRGSTTIVPSVISPAWHPKSRPRQRPPIGELDHAFGLRSAVRRILGNSGPGVETQADPYHSLVEFGDCFRGPVQKLPAYEQDHAFHVGSRTNEIAKKMDLFGSLVHTDSSVGRLLRLVVGSVVRGQRRQVG